MIAKTYPTYDAFWLDYLMAHSKSATRRVHYAGTALALFFAGALIATQDWRYLAAAIVTPYAFAWASHFLIQGNQPVSFRHPVWSLISGARMFGFWLDGRLNSELVRAGVALSA